MSINTVTIEGNLYNLKDDSFTGPNGPVAKAEFTVGHNRYDGKGPDGASKYAMDFWNVEAFGYAATQVLENCDAGGSKARIPVVVQGEMILEHWEDKHTNQERTRPVIRAREVSQGGQLRDLDMGSAINAVANRQPVGASAGASTGGGDPF